MKRLLLIACSFLLLVSSASGQRNFLSKEHRIAASLPAGWDEVLGISRDTVLKLARASGSKRKARITIVLSAIPTGRVSGDYDIWSMTNAEIRLAVQRGSLTGERVSVLDVGRATIDGIHVVWNKNRRQMPDSDLWEFVYEGIRGSQYLTIRLTTYGDETWFGSNQAVFADFVRSVRLKVR